MAFQRNREVTPAQRAQEARAYHQEIFDQISHLYETVKVGPYPKVVRVPNPSVEGDFETDDRGRWTGQGGPGDGQYGGRGSPNAGVLWHCGARGGA